MQAGRTQCQCQAIAVYRPFLSQVLGTSETPLEFSLINAAGTHTTSMNISSPVPGELVFSSFHSLLSGPYFWVLPARFLGDKVGRGGKRKGIPGCGNRIGNGLEAGVLWCLGRRGGRGAGSSGSPEQWQGPTAGTLAEHPFPHPR